MPCDIKYVETFYQNGLAEHFFCISIFIVQSIRSITTNKILINVRNRCASLSICKFNIDRYLDKYVSAREDILPWRDESVKSLMRS